jgi:divalent metal cation (Fe/Co/Zn/Cd) transporter
MGEGYEAADDWAALLASGFIIYNAYLIFRPALGEIMDEHLHDDMIEKIRSVSKEVKGVVDTEKCFVRKSGITFHVDLHLIVDGSISVTEGHEIAHRLKNELQGLMPEISDVLIHVEPDD